MLYRVPNVGMFFKGLKSERSKNANAPKNKTPSFLSTDIAFLYIQYPYKHFLSGFLKKFKYSCLTLRLIAS